MQLLGGGGVLGDPVPRVRRAGAACSCAAGLPPDVQAGGVQLVRRGLVAQPDLDVHHVGLGGIAAFCPAGDALCLEAVAPGVRLCLCLQACACSGLRAGGNAHAHTCPWVLVPAR